ncbi:hypothetical protein LZ198_25420 [Myxococcus sp. K15C18031901]|uniref:hypothetical protein n=1 Tax=Myxococcus dinghuensis TaxID=2906761 RepID=UPI0020A80525|nr:hypothetical protein [Myxococcus dinghuensis]MCP3102214.1 hypothetical protein [Myxococcus dinghuensis]
MAKRWKAWGMLAVVLAPVVGVAQTSGPFIPTGPGGGKDPTEIGDKPPPDPTDEGGICPGLPGSD